MRIRSYIYHALFLLLPLGVLFPLPFLRYLFALLIVLIVSGRLYTRQIRKHLVSWRRAPATCLFYGEEGHVDIHVRNTSRLPAPFLLLEDRPDFFLNYFGRQLFLFSLRGREERRVRYRLQGHQRGQFMLRDWAISSSDIFGLAEWERQFSDQQIITVFPRVFTFQNFFTSYRQPFGEIKNKYPIFEEMSKPLGVRKYQSGDPRKKINWKLSAKTGELMINQYTPTISQNTLLIVNMSREDYDFRFSEFYTELALEVAASAMHYLVERKQEIGILTKAMYRELYFNDSNEIDIHESVRKIHVRTGAGSRHYISILEIMAKLHSQREAPFTDILQDMENISTASTSLLIITPDITLKLTEQLLVLRSMGYEVHVFVFGPSPQKHYSVSSHGIAVYYIHREESLLVSEPLHD